MSIEAMKWAMEQTIVTKPTDRHVLLCIANNARDDGTAAFPSVSTLARKTGLSERAVQYAIKRLVDCGAMVTGSRQVVNAHIKRSDRRPNCYDLSILRGASDNINGVHHVRPDNLRGANGDVNGVQMATERGAPRAPEPSINHPVEPSNRDSASAKRGTRLPQDWQPPDELIAWAQAERPDVDPQTEAAKFRDYWHAIPGAKGRKLDWAATWRNWIRRSTGPPRKIETNRNLSAVERVEQEIMRRRSANTKIEGKSCMTLN